MNERFLRTLFVVIFLLLVALGTFFMTLLEKKTEEVTFGPNAEARTNPRLAALKMFERLGVPTSSVRDPEVLPAAGTMVILPSEVYLDPGRVGRWRDWVKEGGILVIGLDLEKEARDRLLDGITGVVPRELEQGKAKDGASETGTDSAPVKENKVEGLPTPDTSADSETAAAAGEKDEVDEKDIWLFDPISGDPVPKIRLRLTPNFVIPLRDIENCVASYSVDYGGVVGIFAEGKGFLVVLADDTVLSNERISDADHVVFLWHLLHYFEPIPDVVVLLGDRDGLFAFLWRHAAPLLVSLLLLTLFFVWERAPRFGPHIESRKSGQRGLRTHLQAASLFLWRHHEQDALIVPLRAEIHRRARLAIPGWSSLKPAQARAELARISRLPLRDIGEALDGVTSKDPQDFVNWITTLETLRKAL